MANMAGGFVVMDRAKVVDRKIVKGKRSSTGEGRKQCLLTMDDAWDKNDMKAGFLDGFCYYRYDMLFQRTTKCADQWILRKAWMEKYSVLVACLYPALCDGCDWRTSEEAVPYLLVLVIRLISMD